MLKGSKLTVLKIPQIPDHFGVTVSSWHPCGLDTFSSSIFGMVLGGTLVLTVRGQHCSGARIGSQGPALLWGQGGRIGSQGPQLLWVQGAELVGKGQHCCGVHGTALTVKAPLCHTRGCTGTEGSLFLPVLWGQSLKT